MNREINYPIKYAILELKKIGGLSVGYENITQGFIVSKCYVVESNVTYHSDGKSEITHKVVFPFENISYFESSLMYGEQNIGEKRIPSYDTCLRPYPINIVTDLFDTYEEAKIIAEKKNGECRRSLIHKVTIGNSNWKEKFEELQQEFEQKLKLCNLFEKLVLEATEDMNITEQLSGDEQKPIVRVLKPKRNKI